MRICFLANSESSHTKKWAEYFVNAGHEVHVVSHCDVDIPGVNVHYIDFSIRNFPFMAGKVHETVRKINPDILHAHQANTCGLYASTIKGYKYIISTWGSDILVGPEKSLILKKIAQHVLKKAYFITSDSYYMSEKIVKLGGAKEKIFTFPMGIEDNHIKERHKFDLSKKSINIISMRRHEKMFRVDTIINGFSVALTKCEDMFLTVAADGTETNNLKNLVKKLGIESKVRFTGSYKPHDVGKLLEGNDIYISVPESDSTSVSLLEGMYCGLFPVLCALPANKEWVADRENGLIIENVNAENISDALLWCYENKAHMAGASEKNVNIIKERALWKNNTKIVENLYTKMLEENFPRC